MKVLFHFLFAFVAATVIVSSAHAGEGKPAEFALPLEAFKPHPTNKNQKVYVKPGIDLKKYHGVIIEPLVFTHQQADGQSQLLVIEEQSRIAQYFQHSLAAAFLAQNIAVVTQAGPGIARLRVGISDIKQEKPGLGVTDLMPVKAVFNVARKAADADPYVVKMTNMAQLEDSVSNEIIAGSIILRETSKTKTSKQQITKEWVKDAIDRWNKEGAVAMAKQLSPAPAR